MIEAHFEGAGRAPAQPPSRGDEQAGPGVAPGVRAPSSPPRTSTPDAIRAILAGISNPAPASPTLTVVRPDEGPAPAAGTEGHPTPASEEAGAPGAALVLEDPGALTLASADVVLPHIVESARAAGRQLTVVVARPGPAATPGVRPVPSPPGAVADLAAALAVSLDPEQDLLSDGPGHLVVTTPGGSGRRDITTLMQRAAEAGAPMFTWAAARLTRDAQSAAALLDLARARVDGTEPVVERERRSMAAAVWAGAAAALLVAAFAFIAHGHGSSPQASGTAGGHGAAGGTHLAASGLSGTGGSGAAGESVSGGSGYRPSGYSGSGTGAGTSTGNAGGTGSSGTGGGTGTSSPPTTTGNTTASTTGNTPTTTTANNTGTTTASSTSPTTTTTVCSYNLLGQLICTVNGILGGH
jgi:hypothetical protein